MIPLITIPLNGRKLPRSGVDIRNGPPLHGHCTRAHFGSICEECGQMLWGRRRGRGGGGQKGLRLEGQGTGCAGWEAAHGHGAGRGLDAQAAERHFAADRSVE